MLQRLKEASIGVYKINYAGGEPLRTNYAKTNLGEYLKRCKELGFKTSIISNAKCLTKSWLEKYGPYID